MTFVSMSSGWKQSRRRKRNRKGGVADDSGSNDSGSCTFAILFPCEISGDGRQLEEIYRLSAAREAGGMNGN